MEQPFTRASSAGPVTTRACPRLGFIVVVHYGIYLYIDERLQLNLFKL